MAVPARRKSKTKKRLGRTHKKLNAPAVHFDAETGEYRQSHRVSLDGYYKGKKVT